MHFNKKHLARCPEARLTESRSRDHQTLNPSYKTCDSPRIKLPFAASAVSCLKSTFRGPASSDRLSATLYYVSHWLTPWIGPRSLGKDDWTKTTAEGP